MEEEKYGEESARKRNSRMLLVLLLLIIVLLLVSIVLLLPGGEEEQSRSRDAEAVQGLVAERSQEELQALLDQVVEDGMFNVSINGRITVGKDGKGDVCIENIEGNNYLMEVTIVVTDQRGTEVPVYQSGVLDIGYSIENGTFQTLPPVGYTDALAVFTALDPETEAEVGRTSASVILIREAG